MPNPKRKHSKARTASRRAQYLRSLSTPRVMECPNCGDPKQLHRACASCGHYRGRRVTKPIDEA